MISETLPWGRHDQGQNTPGQFAQTGEAQSDTPQDGVLILGGAGQNADHMSRSIKGVNSRRRVDIAEVRKPSDISYDELHLVNTPEGKRSLAQAIGAGAFRAVYDSTVPRRHVGNIEEYLQYIGTGLIDFVVVAKPAVQSIPEMKRVDAALKAAEEQRADSALAQEYDSKLYVHEHYLKKGAWRELRKHLGEVTNRLGRLKSVRINIEEARTVEQEGRVAAFEGGALEDLGPHVISLGLDIQASINSTDRYKIPGRSTTSIKRYRYEESDLPEDVETGFSVSGKTKIYDTHKKAITEQHGEEYEPEDLLFTWQGGKGLIDRKEVIMEFEDPETGEISIVKVDLAKNTLEVPGCSDLFPTTPFDDNGYGHVVEKGLDGQPDDSFQTWDQARIVTKWTHHLARQNSPITTYVRDPLGISLHDLEQVS